MTHIDSIHSIQKGRKVTTIYSFIRNLHTDRTNLSLQEIGEVTKDMTDLEAMCEVSKDITDLEAKSVQSQIEESLHWLELAIDYPLYKVTYTRAFGRRFICF